VRLPLALATAAGTLALMAGCGGSSSTTTASSGASATKTPARSAYGHSSPSTVATTAASSTPTTSAPAGALVLAKHAKLGTILAVGPRMLTVYLFEGDKDMTSNCSGACAAAWPPVITAQAPTAGANANAAALGTVTRADGTKQVTYNGHPLYFFSRDGDKGDAYGQGVKAFGADWYVLRPNGEKLDKS
jgi:predicted lipoprotein with Yx(FWY)xxD motif